MEKFVTATMYSTYSRLKKLMEKILSPKKQQVLQPIVLHPVRNPPTGLQAQTRRSGSHVKNN